MVKRYLVLYIAIFTIFGICVYEYAHAAAPSSQSENFAIEQYVFNEGTAWAFGTTFDIPRSNIGESVIGIVIGSNLNAPVYSAFQGFLYVTLYIPPLPDYQYDIAEIYSEDYFGGNIIEAETWQTDSDPYFYWTLKVVGLEVLGYSVAFDEYPDEFVDVTEAGYQTPEYYLEDGKHTFYVIAKNTDGNFGSPGTFEIWVDATRPQISDFIPINGSTTSEIRPPIQAVLFDATSGIDPASILFTITTEVDNFTATGTYDPDTGSVVYVPDFDFPDGLVTVRLQVSDLAGNEAVPVFWSFTVATTPPSGWIIINGDAPITETPTVYLNLFAEDLVTEVTEMIISSDGVFDTEEWEPYSTEKANWELPLIAGTRTVWVKFRDSAMNESEIYSDSIVLVLVTPDTFIIESPPSITENTTASFKFASTISSSQYQYKLDNSAWSAFSTDDTVFFGVLTQGNHYFQVRAGKDLDISGTIDEDEIDESPAVVSWTVGSVSSVPSEAEQPIRYYKKE